MLATCCRLTSRSLRLDRVTTLGPTTVLTRPLPRGHVGPVCQIERLRTYRHVCSQNDCVAAITNVGFGVFGRRAMEAVYECGESNGTLLPAWHVDRFGRLGAVCNDKRGTDESRSGIGNGRTIEKGNIRRWTNNEDGTATVSRLPGPSGKQSVRNTTGSWSISEDGRYCLSERWSTRDGGLCAGAGTSLPHQTDQ
ncbi:hypothetical protein SBC1_60820 (plasmid) [Caballeronia sp. SBC1]|nr:hypothetical protein SBC2_60450 [Caballeronia sp. SBC2]QIN66036.1 hypothetical protein SBC1_60820 [Caballeronia sp. SBC1]